MTTYSDDPNDTELNNLQSSLNSLIGKIITSGCQIFYIPETNEYKVFRVINDEVI
jgi:hypothetical protein